MVRKRVRIDKSALAIGAPARIRDEKHRRFIASLPCLKCQCTGRTQAAHIRAGQEGGAGLKPSDDLTIPLCVECHLEQGRDEKRFHGDVDRVKALARALFAVSGDWLEATRLITAYR